MVRKWSYLNNYDISLNTPTYSLKVNRKYCFRVFKKTTRFKKHNLGLTKITRKLYGTRRHRNNWFTMTYVTSQWSKFYLKNRQFTRFYQSLGLFNCYTYSPTVNIFFAVKQKLINPKWFFFTSCSKKIALNFSYTQHFTGTQLSSLMVLHRDDLNAMELINPGLVSYDQIFTPYNYTGLIESRVKFKLMQVIVFKSILRLLVLFYKMLIGLTLKY